MIFHGYGCRLTPIAPSTCCHFRTGSSMRPQKGRGCSNAWNGRLYVDPGYLLFVGNALNPKPYGHVGQNTKKDILSSSGGYGSIGAFQEGLDWEL